MHDPSTQICSFPNYSTQQWMEKRRWIPRWVARFDLFTLWHEDPNVRGDDDSCGWFKRARHGDQAVLKKIEKRFSKDWDRVYKSQDEDSEGKPIGPVRKVYFMGYFYPEDTGAGMPNMGVTAIVLNLFFLAANEHFKCNGCTSWKKSRRWMQKHLFDIMLFAENPTDSLRQEIVRHWGADTKRDERIHNIAPTIYGWILRETRPWYRHPRWHVRHWQIQIHPWQRLRRWLLSRCCKCGKRFKYGECPVTDQWDTPKPKFLRGESHIRHDRCGQSHQPSQESAHAQ